jgi:hypothetical protein
MKSAFDDIGQMLDKIGADLDSMIEDCGEMNASLGRITDNLATVRVMAIWFAALVGFGLCAILVIALR